MPHVHHIPFDPVLSAVRMRLPLWKCILMFLRVIPAYTPIDWQELPPQHPNCRCVAIPELEEDDICGLCGEPGADKIPHQVRWPGERHPESAFIHSECEQEECRRAHAKMSDQQRAYYIREISKYG